ncbi:unnamed protein product [Choristocarpus tenellus]
MRSVRVALPLALMLGLVGSSSAFLVRPNVLPSHVMVPAHKYNAALCGVRAQPRVYRHLRTMSATVESTETEVSDIPGTEPEAVAAADPVAIDSTTDDVEGVSFSDDEPAAEIPLSNIKAGEEYEGVVNNVVSYGAFVDVGTEVNGLVHISQLADEFVANTEDHVSEGDTVRVRVLSVDPEGRKLVLSMRQNPRPARATQGDVSKYADMLSEDAGQFIEGKVDSVVTYGAFIQLPDGCSGFVHISQVYKIPIFISDVRDELSIGDTVSVRIREVDNRLKRINLSLLPLPAGGQRELRGEKDVSIFRDADKEELRTGIVSAVTQYGVFVNLDGVDGLLHISKIREDNSLTVEQMQAEFVEGQEVQVRILDVNENTNKMSLTMLPYQPEADFSRYVDISPEDWIEGEVVSTMGYGAFVHLGDGIDGMVHISQMSNTRVQEVTDILNVGDKVSVRVIEANPITKKIRLTMTDFGVGPDQGGGRSRSVKSVDQFLDIPQDEWIPGTVQTIRDFGAFVSIDEDTDGLLHISQIADEHIDNVSDILQARLVGQEVQVRVIEVDTENRRIGLSMKPARRSKQGRGPKKDVSVLMGANPEEFISGQVVSIVSYGAFVNIMSDSIDGGIDGLVHISELAVGRVDTVEDIVQIGQEVQVRISDVNPEANTINLSMVPPGQYNRKRDNSGGYEDDGGYGGGRDDYDRDFGSAYGPGGGDGLSEDGQQGGNWQQYLNNYFDDK